MIDECKVTSTFKPSQPNNESRLREEIDRLRQRQLLRDDEIKDLRNKNLKLELEIKEKAQRERNVSIPDLNWGELLDYLFLGQDPEGKGLQKDLYNSYVTYHMYLFWLGNITLKVTDHYVLLPF